MFFCGKMESLTSIASLFDRSCSLTGAASSSLFGSVEVHRILSQVLLSSFRYFQLVSLLKIFFFNSRQVWVGFPQVRFGLDSEF